MSKIETILKLADLGYSRVEIEQLMSDTTEKTEPEMINILEKPEQPEEKEEPASEPEEPKVDPYAGRLESIETTLKAIQAQNVRWSSMPESVAKPKSELEIVQEILGGIKNGNE